MLRISRHIKIDAAVAMCLSSRPFGRFQEHLIQQCAEKLRSDPLWNERDVEEFIERAMQLLLKTRYAREEH